MRLRLTLEYDGTGLPRLGRAAGPADRRGRRCKKRSTRVFSAWTRACGGRPDRHRRPRAGAGCERSKPRAGAPPERAAEALNAELPDDVAVSGVEVGCSEFHARRSAQARSYRYRIYRRRTPSPVRGSSQLVVSAAARRGEASRVGRISCSASTISGRLRLPRRSTGPSRARSSRAVWHRRGEALELELTADSVPTPHGRTLVGTMLERSPRSWHACSRARDRAEAGTTAPPWGSTSSVSVTDTSRRRFRDCP